MAAVRYENMSEEELNTRAQSFYYRLSGSSKLFSLGIIYKLTDENIKRLNVKKILTSNDLETIKFIIDNLAISPKIGEIFKYSNWLRDFLKSILIERHFNEYSEALEFICHNYNNLLENKAKN
jgi:hypothetical protein